jgi:hypothetical protein
MPCLRGTRKRLIILQKEQSLEKMPSLTSTKSCMKPQILIQLLLQLLWVPALHKILHDTYLQ